MSDFVNTADVIGDDEMLDQIIMRTVTEYKENRVSKVRGYAFYGCTALTDVDLPNVTEIFGNAFRGCTALTEINLPSATTIGGASFFGCTALTTINVPVADSIQDSAFQSCKALAYADLPCLTILRSASFSNCIALETLILRRTSGVVTMANANAISGTLIASGTGYVYVPKALVDSYKTATNWSTYAPLIRAIEDYPDICGG